MGDTPGVTNTFVATTKAKAAEVNRNFTDLIGDLSSGTSDLFTNGVSVNRLSNGNKSIKANEVYLAVMHTIDTNATYTLEASSSRFICWDTLTINSGASLNLTASSQIIIPSLD